VLRESNERRRDNVLGLYKSLEVGGIKRASVLGICWVVSLILVHSWEGVPFVHTSKK
jgi:hypothetical protein